MGRDVLVRLDETLYAELVKRAGGPRKVSKYLNGLLHNAFTQPDTDLAARVATLEQEVARLSEFARDS